MTVLIRAPPSGLYDIIGQNWVAKLFKLSCDFVDILSFFFFVENIWSASARQEKVVWDSTVVESCWCRVLSGCISLEQLPFARDLSQSRKVSTGEGRGESWRQSINPPFRKTGLHVKQHRNSWFKGRAAASENKTRPGGANITSLSSATLLFFTMGFSLTETELHFPIHHPHPAIISWCTHLISSVTCFSKRSLLMPAPWEHNQVRQVGQQGQEKLYFFMSHENKTEQLFSLCWIVSGKTTDD